MLFVTTMLRVMGSLPAVKLPKLTVIGVTETRGRTMPETGISRFGCCDARRDADRGVQRPSGASGGRRRQLVLLARRPAILSLSPAGEISALT